MYVSSVKREKRMINGIINVYKEKGFTSHDVVAKLRGILKQKKIGHTGTLDPDAVGVLPVCLGKGTRLCDMLTDETKTYVAGLLLGKETDTQDMSGTVLKEMSYENLTEEQVTEVIHSFIGNRMQVPPMYSALKVNGQKLYDLARQGKVVERKARPVIFYEIKILEMNIPHIKIEVTCSKGTYIRTLCHDIGQRLGCGGCMESLVRTKVGRFEIEDSLTLKQIEELRDKELQDKEVQDKAVQSKEVQNQKVANKNVSEKDSFSFVHTVESMFTHLPAVVVPEGLNKALYNGNSIRYKRDLQEAQEVRMYTSTREFIGIFRYEQEKKLFHIVKMFYER